MATNFQSQLMAYYTREELQKMNFLHLGENVLISTKTSIYDCDRISLSDHCRIDDFCILSGQLTIGQYVHITPYCLLAGGTPGIVLEDFTTLAYGVFVFAQTDDYSGETMVNSLIPEEFKNENKQPVLIKKHSIIGTRSVIMQGVTLAEGSSIGAMSLVIKNTKPWGVYAGIPVKRIKERSKALLKLHDKFISN